MAQLIMTHVRTDTTKPWVIVTAESAHSDLYTAEEINILNATKQSIFDIPGYQSATHSFPDNNTYIITMHFDTLQHAQNAINTFNNPEPNSLLELRKAFLIKKRSSLGIKYDITFEAIE